MAFTAIADASAASTSGTSVTTGAINTTGANLLIIWTSEQAEFSAGTVSDNKGNTWVAAISKPANEATAGSRVRCWVCLNPTSVGSGHTATATGPKPSISFEAYATGSTVASIDTSIGATTTSSVVGLATGTLTPAGNNELLLSACAFFSNTTAAVTASYTALNTVASTTAARGLATAYQIQTTGTARNPTWSVTTPAPLSVAQIAFRVLSGGTGTLTVTKATVPVGSAQVFTFNAFGTSVTTLYTASGNITNVYNPTYSPDGTTVVFAADGANPGIYTILTDGTGLTRLTNGTVDRRPAYNPAGTRIVYTHQEAGGDNQIYIMHADGSVQTALTTTGGGLGRNDATFRPDGNKIIYTQFVLATGIGSLYTMNTDGTAQTLLYAFSGLSGDYAWGGIYSPDSVWIAFTVSPVSGVPNVNTALWRINADTTGLLQLTNYSVVGVPEDIWWAPDTSGLVFEVNNNLNLCWIAPDGSGLSTIFSGGSAGQADAPSYSPSGKNVVFASTNFTTLKVITSLIAPPMFTLTDGQQRTFTALTAGSSYRLSEDAVSGWATVYTVSNGSITAITIAANATTTVVTTNTYSSPAVTTRAIRRMRQGPYITDPENHYWLRHSRVEVLIKSGVGNTDAPSPTMTLQWSDDYGHTWSTGLSLSMGASTQYLQRLFANRLGRSRDRIYRVWTESAVDVAIVDAFLWAEVGIS